MTTAERRNVADENKIGDENDPRAVRGGHYGSHLGRGYGAPVAGLVRDHMTARVVIVRSGEPVTAAVDRMTRFGFSALPVVSGSFRLVGMVSLLDVLRYRQAYEAQGVTLLVLDFAFVQPDIVDTMNWLAEEVVPLLA